MDINFNLSGACSIDMPIEDVNVEEYNEGIMITAPGGIAIMIRNENIKEVNHSDDKDIYYLNSGDIITITW